MKRKGKPGSNTSQLWRVSKEHNGPALSGVHPIFGDLERKAALRKTYSIGLVDADVGLLYNLLFDADECLNEMSSVLDATLEALGEENRDFSVIPLKVKAMHATNEPEVEAMATAFVLLVRDENVQIDLLHANEETTDAVNAALDVLAADGQ